MILELLVENFAIIEKINVKFSEGLNIMTGETGTGKSIIIDAINLLLGNRSDKNLIRYKKESALIEASFQVLNIEKNKFVLNILYNYGIKLDEEDNILVISREIHSNGRNVSRINGRVVNLSILKDIVPKLLDIQGQHENQKLLKTEEQIDILDSLLDDKFKKLKEDLKKDVNTLREIEKKLQVLNIDEIQKEREIELLNYQLKEIYDSNIKEYEEEELIKKYRILEESENIKKAIFKCIDSLGGDDYNSGILSVLFNLGSEIKSFSDMDKNLQEFSENLLNAYYILQELNRELNIYGENIEYSEEEFFEISNRIDCINSLKRKYGNTIEEINAYRDKMEKELQRLENIDKEIKKINDEKLLIKKKVFENSEILSAERVKISKYLKIKMEKELKELNIIDATFEVEFTRRDEPNEKGIDNIEFLISANIGQPLRPISKVASGGEISRIMLAFKNIINEKYENATLIFDEIDTGISGRTAQLVGEKILKVSRKNQIICITHLPQIAAMADHHFMINKKVENNITSTNITKLSKEERIKELSRLMGGVSVTESTKKHAEDMINLSEKLK